MTKAREYPHSGNNKRDRHTQAAQCTLSTLTPHDEGQRVPERVPVLLQDSLQAVLHGPHVYIIHSLLMTKAREYPHSGDNTRDSHKAVYYALHSLLMTKARECLSVSRFFSRTPSRLYCTAPA